MYCSINVYAVSSRMNIQQVEQPPVPVTKLLFKFPLHFTGLNPDRESDLQCKISYRTSCSALPSFCMPRVASSTAKQESKAACNRVRRVTVVLKLSIPKDLNSVRNSTPHLPWEGVHRSKKASSNKAEPFQFSLSPHLCGQYW